MNVLNLFFFFFFLLHLSSSNGETIAIRLSDQPETLTDSYIQFSTLASASIHRAHHLKTPPRSSGISDTIFPRSTGEYTIKLNFGTPAQSLPFVVDTGSSVVWFPCTRYFHCRNCQNKPGNNPSFLPKSSSSARVIGCRNPHCSWIHHRGNNCSATASCPPYYLVYGSATTGGTLLSETLSLPGRVVRDFAVGCSLFSSGQEIGVAGFGRGPAGFPSQLGAAKFSYCLLPHNFDNHGVGSRLVVGDEGSLSNRNLTYTPLLKNPQEYNVFYYVDLHAITVGSMVIRVPAIREGGNGGTVVDSGTSFTVVEERLHRELVFAFDKQVRNYPRALSVEKRTGMRPCFDVTGRKNVELPAVSLHFQGGAVMRLPLRNYFSFIDGRNAICMTIIGDGITSSSNGPAVILGNYQQQNFYVEFDLKRERLGFQEESCRGP